MTETPRRATVVTGGSGQLARQMAALDPRLLTPDRHALDVRSYTSLESYCTAHGVRTIVHAAAITNRFTEELSAEYVHTNVIGTGNVALWAIRHQARLVYISTDYVYPSEQGHYTEHAPLFPVNDYAASKLGGEMAVRLHANSVIVRTSFYERLDFPRACVDQFTSRMPIREAAATILALAARDDVRGVINVGRSERRSLHQIVASEFDPETRPIKRHELRLPYPIPRDSSLRTERLERIMANDAPASRDRDTCRICGSDRLYEYLHLGTTPLANSYLDPELGVDDEFREELAIQLCEECGLSQLTKVVHPDRMFRHYLYVSSTTQTFRDHCAEMAATTTSVCDASDSQLVIDIASNDGCLLRAYQERGLDVLGVDPAENLAAEANANGIRTLCAYWSPDLARDIAARFGPARIITATNVFAHVDDLHAFVEGLPLALLPRGIFVVEFPYVLDFLRKHEFDTAYHEHLSYVGLTPLVRLFGKHGLEMFDVEYFPDLHGGTVRVFVSRAGEYEPSDRLRGRLAEESSFGLASRLPYDAFAAQVLENKTELRRMLRGLLDQGKTVWAYGASAKGNTLMNFFELTREEVPVVVDDNPKKWGYLSPGSHMRIASPEELATGRPDCLLLLAWNFAAEISRRCRERGYGGDFIVPIPRAHRIPGGAAQ